jgi:hypothetical protein
MAQDGERWSMGECSLYLGHVATHQASTHLLNDFLVEPLLHDALLRRKRFDGFG